MKGKELLGIMKDIRIIASLIFAITFITCCGLTVRFNRYSMVNAGDGGIYSFDRQTGYTKFIYKNNEVHLTRRINRDLTGDEVIKLDGFASKNSDTNIYAGTIYNGNNDITITEVDITVTAKHGENEITRTYRDKVQIRPLSTASFSVELYRSPKEFGISSLDSALNKEFGVKQDGISYEWCFSGAKGYLEY